MGYDVIIVGAGPAGGMAARQISAKGFSVLVLEKKRKVGQPVQCGEAISHAALVENGLAPGSDWVKLEVKGAKPVMPDNSFFFVSKKGYSIDRTAFDRWLMDGAVDSGAELMLNTRAKGVKEGEGKWIVATDKNEFEGTLLIGADGPSSTVARQVGLLGNRVFARAMEYKFRDRDVKLDEKKWFSFYMGASWQGGSAWAFPRGDEWNIGVGGFGQTPRSLEAFLKRLKIDGSKAFGKLAGLVPYRYELTHMTSEGLMIAGDAAGLTNPLIGSGVRTALSSGRTAGETAVQALESEDRSLTAEYEKRMKEHPSMAPVLQDAAGCLRDWTDEDWNFLGRMMNERDESQLTMLQATAAALRKPKYLLRGREFLTIRNGIRLTNDKGW